MSGGKLVILRGPSGSGKSTIARAVREQATSPTALIEQDHLRRIVLKEPDQPGGHNIELIYQTVTFALDHGYHVILEGILTTKHYGEMLARLTNQTNLVFPYYFDIPFEETLRRHATKPNAYEFGESEMRGWYQANDVLNHANERVVPAHQTFAETVHQILTQTKL